MGDVTKGIEAGFVATIIVTLLLFVQQMSGMASDFTLIAWLNQAVGTQQIQPITGWVLHFVIGAGLWGAGFAVFSPHLWGPHWIRGLSFGFLTWLLMMILFLPSAGVPMFAMGMGISIPVIGLVLNLVFGLVLGETYHLLLHYLPSEVDENA